MSSRNAGKGMKPKKGYDAKNWYANYDLIDWSEQPEITVKIDENTIGYLPIEKEKNERTNRRTKKSD